MSIEYLYLHGYSATKIAKLLEISVYKILKHLKIVGITVINTTLIPKISNELGNLIIEEYSKIINLYLLYLDNLILVS